MIAEASLVDHDKTWPSFRLQLRPVTLRVYIKRQNVVTNIEIINNTRGGIEGKIGERGVWGANSSPGCSLIHDVPDKKSRFRRIFQLFFAVKILKISFQTI